MIFRETSKRKKGVNGKTRLFSIQFDEYNKKSNIFERMKQKKDLKAIS